MHEKMHSFRQGNAASVVKWYKKHKSANEYALKSLTK